MILAADPKEHAVMGSKVNGNLLDAAAHIHVLTGDIDRLINSIDSSLFGPVRSPTELAGISKCANAEKASIMSMLTEVSAKLETVCKRHADINSRIGQ
jgi:hypothetical protein